MKRHPLNYGIAILLLVCLPDASSAAERKMFVVTNSAKEHLCAAATCPITNTIYRGQVVTVLESTGGWARVSPYYSSAPEKVGAKAQLPNLVARWVQLASLSDKPPTSIAQPTLSPELADPRIRGIPKPGEGGLNAADVLLLRKFSSKLLANGSCKKIDYGDKSISKAGTYYVLCEGETKNRFFTPADIK
jgi:hypothetical protein